MYNYSFISEGLGCTHTLVKLHPEVLYGIHFPAYMTHVWEHEIIDFK